MIRRPARRGHLLRNLRISALLVLLLVVALGSWQARLMATDWEEPLWVTLHPLNGDGSAEVEAFLPSLTVESFTPLEPFFVDQARRFGVPIEIPVTVRLAPRLHEMPPLPPVERGLLGTVWWSLRLRYWSFTIGRRDGSPPADIRLFARYFDSAQTASLPHSLGLEEGRVGIVNLYAGKSYAGRNRVVIAHELLHTIGATDKYDPATNQPLHPDGFADPDLEPRYPQRQAEIMGGRIALSATRARMPADLDEVVVGPLTAGEIRWRE